MLSSSELVSSCCTILKALPFLRFLVVEPSEGEDEWDRGLLLLSLSLLLPWLPPPIGAASGLSLLRSSTLPPDKGGELGELDDFFSNSDKRDA